MGKKLELNELKRKVYENSLNTCVYIDGYRNKTSDIRLKCLIHNNIFETKAWNLARDSRKKLICPICKTEHRNSLKNKETCSYCGKIFFKNLASYIGKKTNLKFCCKECKDKAQQIKAGSKFKEMRPNFYSDDFSKCYRHEAFNEYEHKCYFCGFDEDDDILEVHHIDKNRDNNDIKNLMIICPNCHTKIHNYKYIIKNNMLIKKSEFDSQ